MTSVSGASSPPVSPPTPLSSLSDTEPEHTKTEPVNDTRKKGTARERRERLKRQAARAGTYGKLMHQLRNQQRIRRKLNAEVRILADLCRFPVAAEYRELPSLPSRLAPVKDSAVGQTRQRKTLVGARKGLTNCPMHVQTARALHAQ